MKNDRGRSYAWQERPHALMFHHFHGPAPPEQGSVSGEELAGIIDFVGRERILPAREWLERAVTGTLEGPEVCLSFDDGLRCQYDTALPVLESLGIEAFWFTYTAVLDGELVRMEIYRRFRNSMYPNVNEFYADFFRVVTHSDYRSQVASALAAFSPSGYLPHSPFYTAADRRFRFVRDRVLGVTAYEEIMDGMIEAAGTSVAELAEGVWLEESHLRELHSAGHVIGMHSHTHPLQIGELSAEAQEREYTANYERLKALLGEAPLAMSHPHNSYGDETLRILRRLGVKVGFRANMGLPQFTDLEFPRQDHANIVQEMAA